MKFLKISFKNRIHIYIFSFFCFLLNISSGWYSHPKFSNPVDMNPVLKKFWFSGNFYYYETKFPVSKKFTNFRVRFLNDSFPILEGIECNSFRKFSTKLGNIAYFTGFRRNNSVLKQNNREFKKYELRKKSIFQQLNTKIANFADFRRNNSVLTHKKNWTF